MKRQPTERGNHQQNEETTYWMGGNICKWYDGLGVKTAHTTQYQKTEQPDF